MIAVTDMRDGSGFHLRAGNVDRPIVSPETGLSSRLFAPTAIRITPDATLRRFHVNFGSLWHLPA